MIQTKEYIHAPVMIQESLASLTINPSGTYVDLTFGGGGHSRAILEHLTKGRLLAFDQDKAASQVAAQISSERFTFIQANFRSMRQFLCYHGVQQVSGILADLGVSSHQIDTPERGFSTRGNAKLDMRMNQTSDLTAQEIIDTYSVDQLQELLQNYGEIRNARTLAKAIAVARAEGAIQTTQDLKLLLQRWALKGRESKYYAQVFQAFRIEVNDELEALKEVLQQSASLLEPGGRLAILSYHSLEDRIVKRFLSTGNFEGEMHKDIYGNVIRPLDPIYKKPITPSEKEVRHNNRSRTAKLRVGAKR